MTTFFNQRLERGKNMNNTELTKIREEKKLSKSEFAKLLDITPMILGKYEKGSCKIPDSLVEKLKTLADAATVAEIEVKKTARKTGRITKETAEKAAETLKKTAKKAAGIPNIIIQSPLGGAITPEDIADKVPKKTTDVYVRVDENKLYYVLENGETGDVDIWE